MKVTKRKRIGTKANPKANVIKKWLECGHTRIYRYQPDSPTATCDQCNEKLKKDAMVDPFFEYETTMIERSRYRIRGPKTIRCMLYRVEHSDIYYGQNRSSSNIHSRAYFVKVDGVLVLSGYSHWEENQHGPYCQGDQRGNIHGPATIENPYTLFE